MFIEQFLTRDKMKPWKIRNGGYYEHAQVLILITTVWVKIQLNL